MSSSAATAHYNVMHRPPQKSKKITIPGSHRRMQYLPIIQQRNNHHRRTTICTDRRDDSPKSSGEDEEQGGYGLGRGAARTCTFADNLSSSSGSSGEQANNYSTMAASLITGLNKFKKYVRYLKRLLKDTKRTLEEIGNSGAFYREYMAAASINPQDLEKISKSLERVPCVVVHGQSSIGKASMVNEILGKHILPVRNNSTEETAPGWRMVHFRYGSTSQISYSIPNSYELVEKIQMLNEPHSTVTLPDVEVTKNSRDSAVENAVLEVQLNHSLLKEEMDLIVTPSTPAAQNKSCNIEDSNTLLGSSTIARLYSEGMLPIVIYAISEDRLTEENIRELAELRSQQPELPVFFIRVRSLLTMDLTESEQHAQIERLKINYQNRKLKKSSQEQPLILSEASLDLYHQLCDLGYLGNKKKPIKNDEVLTVESEFAETFDQFCNLALFMGEILETCVVNASGVLHAAHEHCLKIFIHAAFDMARDLLITPKRIDYARRKELELYNTLLNIANDKQLEMKQLIIDTVNTSREELVAKAAAYKFKGINLSHENRISSAKELSICTGEIQDLILSALNDAVATKLTGSVDCLRECVVGTLKRCLESLENVNHDGHESANASMAFKHILTAAYEVEVTIKTSSSAGHVFLEKMKQLMQMMPGKTPPHINEEWKMWVATDVIESLSAWRLAKSICSQFRERLKNAHEAFATSLKHLENHHSGRLERTEEQRLKVRKIHAPRLARYSLESTSLRHIIRHGMPKLGREIGRGQYGVVYSCEWWGGHASCAVKSVVPPDDKHWNDLALEFHYTRSVPKHSRIVKLYGAIIDHSYGGGNSPAVLLIMERLQKDLYSAIRSGIDWLTRLQVAIDAVEGIRFLHSQGLVHRDIKLKNVLLDKRNRAKITDLGFCKPEAMMSGSIVGTPIHMAPELFCGKYDHRVDVYAFGILFWYICAGHVRLPFIYEQCQNKDQLWNDVKRGVRPERLPVFDDMCWSIMEECWSGDPSNRPLLGDVEQRLNKVINHYKVNPAPRFDFRQREVGILSSSPYIDIDY